MAKKSNECYSKQQILSSTKFTDVEKDVLSALLDDKTLYSLEGTQDLLKKEMKRVVC